MNAEDIYRSCRERKNFGFLLTLPAGTEIVPGNGKESSTHYFVKAGNREILWRDLRRSNLYNGFVFAEIHEAGQVTHTLEWRCRKDSKSLSAQIWNVHTRKAYYPVVKALSGHLVMRTNDSAGVPYSNLRDAWLALFEAAAAGHDDEAAIVEDEKNRIHEMMRLAQSKDVVRIDNEWREIIFSSREFLLVRDPFIMPDADDVIYLLGAGADDCAGEIISKGSIFYLCGAGVDQVQPGRRKSFRSLSGAMAFLFRHSMSLEERSGHECMELRLSIDRVRRLAATCRTIEEFAFSCRRARGKTRR